MKLHRTFAPVPPVCEFDDIELELLNHNDNNGRVYTKYTEDVANLPLGDRFQALLEERDRLYDESGRPRAGLDVTAFSERLIASDINRIQKIQQQLAQHGVVLTLERPDTSY